MNPVQVPHLKRYPFLAFILCVLTLSTNQLFAQCTNLPTTYWLIGTAASATTNPGDSMITTNTGTANGFTPTSVLSTTPLYWYSPTFSGMINAGNYTLNLWTNAPATDAYVTVQLGYSNPNGTGYVSLGSSTADVFTTGGGNHITGFSFNIPALSLTNKVFVISISEASGASTTIVYNDGTDFGSDLTTPTGQTFACPTWTPTPCGYTQQIETPTTNDEILHESNTSNPQPSGWQEFSDATASANGFSNAVVWTDPTGPGIGGVPWVSWDAAGNGASPPDALLGVHSFTIPAAAINITGTLYIAADDNSSSWINGTGVFVDPSPLTDVTYQGVSIYSVPAGSLVPGSNVLAVMDANVDPVVEGYTFELFINYVIPCSTPTNTPTNTSTPTFTATFTKTFTPTFTNSATATDTSTFTNTFTSTFTNTYTKTFTNTFTSTMTNTFTNTFTATPTNTLVNTPTVTSTFTNTCTPTFTSTFTNTDTSTMTNTFTDTVTNTFTPTFTNTLINTATPTNSFTNTPTSTFTPTITNTDTPTVTSTFTYTPTNSFTPTFTNTLINTATITNTFTSTLTNTSTDSATPTSSPTNTLVNTSTFTNTFTPTFTNSFTASPTATPTLTFTSTDSFTPTNTSTKTYTNTSTPTLTDTSSPTNTPTVTWTYTETFTPTPVGQFTVSVNVYNSAGELVKTIFVKKFIQPVNNISLPSNVITTLTGPGSTIQIYYQGLLIGTWDGSNNIGNPESNGTYQIQVDNAGVSGVVTSVSQSVIVNRQLSTITASVFNSAGEVVRNLYQVVANSTSAEMTNVNLSTNTFQPGILTTSGQLTSVQIFVMTSSSGSVTLSWNGTNDSGTVVTPGRYEIEVHWDNGQGGELNITRAILVLAGTGSGGMVVARPNVLVKGITETTFDGSSVLNAATLKVDIYTVSGQLVTVVDSSGSAMALWNVSGVASGIYIASVEVMDGNGSVIHQQRLKLLVIH